MCRLLGYCARRGASAAGLLTGEGLGAFTALSAYHRDGWGMAWYDSGGPQISKSPRRAAEEPDYHRLASRALGDLGLVHLRWATPGLGIGYDNSHPFRYGPYAFAHNGAIHPQDRLGEMLPAEWERRRAGTTELGRPRQTRFSPACLRGGWRPRTAAVRLALRRPTAPTRSGRSSCRPTASTPPK